MRISPSLYLVGGTQEGLTEGFDSHIFLIKGPDGLFLIDAGNGYDVDGLARNIEIEGFSINDVSHLLLTHHHTDHVRGAKEIKDRTGCDVWISNNTGKHLLEAGTDEELGIPFAKAHGMYEQDYVYIHCPVDYGFDDGEQFAIDGVNIQAINVIGHSYDSACFLMELDGRKYLFNGDTVMFGGVVGLINYPMSSIEDYHTGLPKLKDLGIDGLFPGHGILMLKNGQSHIDTALKQLDSIFMPQSVGQMITSIV